MTKASAFRLSGDEEFDVRTLGAKRGWHPDTPASSLGPVK
jgi:hypothetical protein